MLQNKSLDNQIGWLFNIKVWVLETQQVEMPKETFKTGAFL